MKRMSRVTEEEDGKSMKYRGDARKEVRNQGEIKQNWP